MLRSVYKTKDAAEFLWRVMKLRLSEDKHGVNISHRKMPKWKQHLAFIKRRENGDWYLIQTGYRINGETLKVTPIYAGWIYINRASEIGVILLPVCRDAGVGKWAIKEIMRLHPRPRYLANINPKNKRSIKFFKRLGFKLCQETYALGEGK
jgi:RimJ/RimL family protein N-acetyltransferase